MSPAEELAALLKDLRRLVPNDRWPEARVISERISRLFAEATAPAPPARSEESPDV